MQKEGAQETVEADIAVIELQASNVWIAGSHQKLGRGEKVLLSEIPEGNSSVDSLILDFWPPVLRET